MSTRSERARRRAAKLRNQRIALIIVVVLALAGIGYLGWSAITDGGSSTAGNSTAGSSDMTTTDSGLKYQDLTIGTGAEAQPGNTVSVHYTGWLEDGTKFDSSVDRGQPFTFTLGQGDVIPGWDEGVAGMKVGGKRVLIIPPDLAYGASGAGQTIPPNATLKFEVELLGIQ